MEVAQRPKSIQKLKNVVAGLLKRIAGKKPNTMTPEVLIDAMQKQNSIFVDGSTVMYFF